MELLYQGSNALATIVFAVTGVLAASRKNRDIFGMLILGIITAVGGGTLRDLILGTEVFWTGHFTPLALGAAASAAAFGVMKLFRINRDTYRALLYLDAFGVAFFCIEGAEKTLALGFSPGVSVLMGLMTGLGGGVLRDTLSGRPNLLVTKELYASPALIGACAFVLCRDLPPHQDFLKLGIILFIFLFRSLAIFFDWHMPGFLVNHRDPSYH